MNSQLRIKPRRAMIIGWTAAAPAGRQAGDSLNKEIGTDKAKIALAAPLLRIQF